jgi:hypothetical protein
VVETMRSLQKEVQSYREDNERMMRAQEEIATESEYVAETSQ